MIEKEITLNKGQRLSDIMDEIQPDTILHKTVCGIGATTLELNCPRHSIIIEPNVPVIKGKELKYPTMLGVYEGVSTKAITEYIKGEEHPKKIMTTPESFPKIKRAMQKAGTDMYRKVSRKSRGRCRKQARTCTTATSCCTMNATGS